MNFEEATSRRVRVTKFPRKLYSMAKLYDCLETCCRPHPVSYSLLGVMQFHIFYVIYFLFYPQSVGLFTVLADHFASAVMFSRPNSVCSSISEVAGAHYNNLPITVYTIHRHAFCSLDHLHCPRSQEHL